jgi:hypothetical protein
MKMKRTPIFFNITISLLVVSCSGQPSKTNLTENFITLNVVDTTSMRTDVINIIENYMNKFPKFNNFILTCFPDNQVAGKKNQHNRKGFLIGPAYEMAFYDKSPLLFYKIENKKIFVKCGIEELYNNLSFQDSIYYSSQIKRGVDSIRSSDGWVSKNGEILYIHRALYFFMDQNGIIHTNNRPDTLFLPKILESTISFDRNKQY